MLQATTLGAKAAALAGSLLFHVGVVVALSGHAVPQRVAPSVPPLLVEVSALFEPARPLQPDTKPTAEPLRRAAPSSHTHRYPVAHGHDAMPHDPQLVHVPISVSPPTPTRPTFAVAVAPPSAALTPRFAIDVGTRAPRLSAAPVTDGAGASASDGDAVGAVGESAVDVPARLLRGSPPPYPREAAQADLEADVPLEIIVDAAGHVQSARVLRQLGHGLEAASLKALRAYHFSPAILNGRPIPVRMKWTMVFRLQ